MCPASSPRRTRIWNLLGPTCRPALQPSRHISIPVVHTDADTAPSSLYLTRLARRPFATRCVQSLAAAVVPLAPLNRNVLLSGWYWCVAALIASCDAMPPMTDAIACISQPPHRQNSAIISTDTCEDPLAGGGSPRSLTTSPTHMRSCARSDSTDALSSPGQHDRCRGRHWAARSKK